MREADPAGLLAAPCGFEVARTVEELPAAIRHHGLQSLRAVTAGRTYVMDGNRYVNRPSPHLVDTLECLAALLHPAVFPSPPADVAHPVDVREGLA